MGILALMLLSRFVWTSVDPTKGHIELSLKGTDVGGTDPAPKPKRIEEKEKKVKEKSEKGKKRKKVNEAKDDSDDEAEEMLKKLKTGKQHFKIWFNLSAVICKVHFLSFVNFFICYFLFFFYLLFNSV